jgi:hypothetical protein
MTSVAKEKNEICHISLAFPIIVANENFNLAGALMGFCNKRLNIRHLFMIFTSCIAILGFVHKTCVHFVVHFQLESTKL